MKEYRINTWSSRVRYFVTILTLYIILHEHTWCLRMQEVHALHDAHNNLLLMNDKCTHWWTFPFLIFTIDFSFLPSPLHTHFRYLLYYNLSNVYRFCDLHIYVLKVTKPDTWTRISEYFGKLLYDRNIYSYIRFRLLLAHKCANHQMTEWSTFTVPLKCCLSHGGNLARYRVKYHYGYK